MSSPTFFTFVSRFFISIPPSIADKSKALSVGLPLITHFSVVSSIFSMKASLAKAEISKARGVPLKLLFFLGYKISSPVTTRATLIFPSVKVPVLSVKITFVLPKTSVADRFLTNPFLFKILLAPKTKIMVQAGKSPSGIAETTKATPVVNKSVKPKCSNPPTIKKKKNRNRINKP